MNEIQVITLWSQIINRIYLNSIHILKNTYILLIPVNVSAVIKSAHTPCLYFRPGADNIFYLRGAPPPQLSARDLPRTSSYYSVLFFCTCGWLRSRPHTLNFYGGSPPLKAPPGFRRESRLPGTLLQIFSNVNLSKLFS